VLRNSKSAPIADEPKKIDTPKHQPSVFQSLVIGSLGGAGEVLINHPLWTMKTRKQEGKPSLSTLIKSDGRSMTHIARMLYCGVLPNMASMVPTTAIQVGLNRYIQKTFLYNQQEVSTTHKMGAAFTAGVGSALVSCPSELVLISQAGLNYGSGLIDFYKAGASVVQQFGWRTLYRGLPATACRDGVFSMFLLGVVPYSTELLKKHFYDNSATPLFAKGLSGIGATVVSQAVDTIKGKQQAQSNLQLKLGFVQAAADIYSKKGALGFFAGGGWRGARVVSALAIVSTAKEAMEEQWISAYQNK
jgi:hypothetical protein